MNSFFERITGYKNHILLGILILLILGGIGYFVWQKVYITPISEILENASEFDRQEVTIRGTVRRVFAVPLLNKSFALVQDKTGEIWCRLERTDVKEGQAISVTGVVHKLFEIPGLELRVIAIAEKSSE